MSNGSRELRKRLVTVNYKEIATINKVSTTAKPIASQQPSQQSVAPQTSLSTRTSLSSRPSFTARPSLTQSSSPSLTVDRQTILDKIGHIESQIKNIEDKSTHHSRLDAIETAFNDLKAENIELRLTVDRLKSDLDSVQFVLVELCNLESQLKGTEATSIQLTSENQALKTEISVLKSDIAELNSRINSQRTTDPSVYQKTDTDQQHLNCNIVIRGVELSSTSCPSEPAKVFNAIRTHLEIEKDEIFNPVSVKVLPTAASTHASKTIQVQFQSVDSKRQFLQVKRTKKQILPSDLKLVQGSKKAILIAEQLTRGNQELLYAARSLRQTHNFKFVWSNNGQILARQQQGSRVTRITSIDQINELRKAVNLESFVYPRNGRLQPDANLEPLKSSS